jgi:heme A synthase
VSDDETERLSGNKRQAVTRILRLVFYAVGVVLAIFSAHSAAKYQLDFIFSMIGFVVFFLACGVLTIFASLVLPLYTAHFLVIPPLLFVLFRYGSGKGSKMGIFTIILWLCPFMALALSVPEYPLRRR